ncbi:MAG: sigma-70 family RNA polymerase sigma factor [Pirellulales bacterium]
MVCMGLTAKSDAELIAETLAGDREAFGQLYDRHARLVRAVVAGVSGDWSAVEDMTQECFLRAYRKLASLRDRDRFGQWLAGFARRVARERRRSLRRDRHEFGSPVEETLAASDGQAAAHDRDQIERVMRRLAELPEDERLAIHAFFLEGQNAHQAAERLEISRSGFYALVQRALAHLATRPQAVVSKNKAKT